MLCQREEKASNVVRNFHTAITQNSWKMSQGASGKATLTVKGCLPHSASVSGTHLFHKVKELNRVIAALNTFLPSRSGLAEHCNQKITCMKENHDLKCFAVRGKVRLDTGLQNRR